jgi:hypothetical protein
MGQPANVLTLSHFIALVVFNCRRSISRLMIKHSIVKWIVDNSLRDTEVLSDYTLRYSLALLMNISLRALGTIT